VLAGIVNGNSEPIAEERHTPYNCGRLAASQPDESPAKRPEKSGQKRTKDEKWRRHRRLASGSTGRTEEGKGWLMRAK
jgi:hypothetical protein